MATRSRIGMKMPDGKIKSIYCHLDGYIKDGVGEMLEKYYQDPQKIEGLLNLGSISSLGTLYDEEISKADWTKFDIKDPTKRLELIEKAVDCTIAYKDRGEDEPARIDENEEEFVSKLGKCGEEYNYLYKEDFTGVYRWHVYETPYAKWLSEEIK